MAIADCITERHVFGVQICGTRPSAFSEVRPKLSMVEHDQDFICAIMMNKICSDCMATVVVCQKTVKNEVDTSEGGNNI